MKVLFLIFIFNPYILFSEWKRLSYKIYDNNNEVAKKIVLTEVKDYNRKYLNSFYIYANADYSILFKDIELSRGNGMLLYDYAQSLKKFHFIKAIKLLNESKKKYYVYNFYGYIEIKGKNMDQFYIYYNSPLSSGIFSNNCKNIISNENFMDLLTKNKDLKLRNLIDILLFDNKILDYRKKIENKKNYIFIKSYFPCGEVEEKFGFACHKIKEILIK